MGATGRDVHIDVPLSNVAIAFKPEGMIAHQIAPIVTVNKQSDGFYIWTLDDGFRTEEDDRAPGTEANVVTRNVSSDTYYAKNRALKDRLPYEDIANADAGFIFTERSARAEFVTSKLLLNWEVRVASQCTSTSNVGSSSTVASAWSDYDNSDPLGDIDTGINNVEGAIGYRPNRVVIGGDAWNNMKQNATLISRIYGQQTGAKGRLVQPAQVANILEVDEVLIGRAFQNTSEEGQTAALSRIWGDHVLIHYTPKTARKDTPAFMYSFRWGKVMNMTAQVHQLPRAKAEEVEVGYYQDEKITFANAGYLLTNANSSQ
jgi:hypothetical protein